MFSIWLKVSVLQRVSSIIRNVSLPLPMQALLHWPDPLFLLCRAIMTHASIPAEERAKLGILDSLCRLSVGVEDIEDLLYDLSQALDAVPHKKH